MRYCTTSCSKRWVFGMCHHIRMESTFGVVPEEGKHCPFEEPIVGTVVNLPFLMEVSVESVCHIHSLWLHNFSVKVFM